MIQIDGHNIIAVHFAKRAMSAIYKGSRLVWMAVRSCFGSGLWVGKKPWLGKEKWKNKK